MHVIWQPIRLIQRIVGFVVGFLFFKPVGDYLAMFLSNQTVTIPSEIPAITSLLLGSGLFGLILFIIALILGLKFITKIVIFVTWVLIGVLAAILLTAVGFNIPDPVEYLKGLIKL